jgi:branched-chain amino acid transport system ATP-binding protein
VLIGPNGAGKTTLFNCIAGTTRPTSGRVMLFGEDISHLAENRRTARGMGRTFQISNVFTDLTAHQNLMLAIVGTDARKWIMHRPVGAFSAERAQALEGLARVGLGDRADELVKFLSYGERRQLELAMALAMRPKLLLLDEPMAGMGRQDGARMTRILASLKQRYAILLVEHDMSAVAALADRVTVLVAGRTIASGTYDQVREIAEVRAAYLGERR